MQKLIIWDFDGVISDTESLWITTRMDLLNAKKGLSWDFEKTFDIMGGRSDKDKRRILEQMGIYLGDNFWKEVTESDFKRIEQGLLLTPKIEDIFKLSNFAQCIATGGMYDKTMFKIQKVGIESYFPPEKVFTVDLVKYGKPEPDLFLLAAETMGYAPQDTIVVEDSVAGLTAALRAKMTPVAFVKYDTPAAVDEIKKLGIEYIFDDMTDVKNFLKRKAAD